MNNWYVYWLIGCGFLAQIPLLWCGGKILGQLIYAAAAATSITRFAWACARVHGFRPRRFPNWVYAPKFWFTYFRVELGSAPGKSEHFGGSGVWKGIGKWTVHPKKDAE